MNKESIIFITGNEGKAREVAAHSTVPITHTKVDLTEVQSLNLKTVVTHKAQEAHRVLKERGVLEKNQAVLVEDTGLEIEAWRNPTTLEALPGTLIKSFMETVGNEGLTTMLTETSDRRAIARTAFGLTADGESVTIFEGSTQGTIALEPSAGQEGFGWDKIFIPESGDGRTWADMGSDEKYADSMRGKALQAFEVFIARQNPQEA